MQACVSAISMNVDNTVQLQRCLGNSKLGPGAIIATEAAITGTLTLAWSRAAWLIWKEQLTRKPFAVTFPVTDSLGNSYEFNFPSIEVDGELPNGGKRDLIQVTLNWTVAKVAPTITRTTGAPPAVTGVTVNPSTGSIAVSETLQLSASVAPSVASQAVTWSSDDMSVATVSASGLVTALDDGVATITATSVADGTKTSTCAVTVTA